MSAPSQPVVRVEDIELALGRRLAVDDVLDLVDEAIEGAASSGDRASLVRLAVVLEGAAAERSDAGGLAVAARRAKALATTPAVDGSPLAPTPAPQLVARDAGRAVEPTAGAAAPVRYAGWWQRVFAFLIDWIALFVAMAVIPTDDWVWGVVALLGLPLVYFAGMHAFVQGRTIGKAMLGIAVHRDDGRPVDLPTALARAFVQGLLWITVIGGIVDSLVPLADERRRAIHDNVGTVVVRIR